MSNEPRCPKCRGFDLQKTEDHPPLYRCRKCNMLTDCEDDGTVGYGNQERHAERKEEYENRQRNRQAAQRNRQNRGGGKFRW